VQLDYKDDFAGDNVAYAAINVPRRAKVLLVTPQNDALQTALATEQAVKAAQVTVAQPKYLDEKDYATKAEHAVYDLIIYDQCAPKDKLPNCNTLFIGRWPPGTKLADAKAPPPTPPAAGNADGDKPPMPESDKPEAKPRETGIWQVGAKQPAPAIFDTDRAHPLMQYVELGNVRIADATPLTPPPGGAKLIEADIGTIFAIAPRKSFEDAVLAFELVGVDDKGQRYANTDWPIRRSFPLFVMNVLQYLGGQGGSLSTGSVQPGKTITIRTDSPVEKLAIVPPNKKRVQLTREGQATFAFSNTEEPGVYDVVEGSAQQASQRFAVNLFDGQESNILPKTELTVGGTRVQGRTQWEPMRKELWKWILLGALGLLIAEWWIWNRRVYL
jgi:hypothetical protein